MKELNNWLKESQLKLDDLEQCGKHHSVRMSGIPESDRENTDFLVCNFLLQKLDIEINPSEVNRSHRLSVKKHDTTSL